MGNGRWRNLLLLSFYLIKKTMNALNNQWINWLKFCSTIRLKEVTFGATVHSSVIRLKINGTMIMCRCVLSLGDFLKKTNKQRVCAKTLWTQLNNIVFKFFVSEFAVSSSLFVTVICLKDVKKTKCFQQRWPIIWKPFSFL